MPHTLKDHPIIAKFTHQRVVSQANGWTTWYHEALDISGQLWGWHEQVRWGHDRGRGLEYGLTRLDKSQAPETETDSDA